MIYSNLYDITGCFFDSNSYSLRAFPLPLVPATGRSRPFQVSYTDSTGEIAGIVQIHLGANFSGNMTCEELVTGCLRHSWATFHFRTSKISAYSSTTLGMSICIFLHLQLAQPVFRFLGCSKNTTVIISDTLQN